MSVAERSAAYRARRKAEAEVAGKATVVRYRRPADKRSKPQRWQDAVQTLADLLDGYQDWRDSLPASLADSAIADRLDELLTLRDLVDHCRLRAIRAGKGGSHSRQFGLMAEENRRRRAYLPFRQGGCGPRRSGADVARAEQRTKADGRFHASRDFGRRHDGRLPAPSIVRRISVSRLATSSSSLCASSMRHWRSLV